MKFNGGKTPGVRPRGAIFHVRGHALTSRAHSSPMYQRAVCRYGARVQFIVFLSRYQTASGSRCKVREMILPMNQPSWSLLFTLSWDAGLPLGRVRWRTTERRCGPVRCRRTRFPPSINVCLMSHLQIINVCLMSLKSIAMEAMLFGLGQNLTTIHIGE